MIKLVGKSSPEDFERARLDSFDLEDGIRRWSFAYEHLPQINPRTNWPERKIERFELATTEEFKQFLRANGFKDILVDWDIQPYLLVDVVQQFWNKKRGMYESYTVREDRPSSERLAILRNFGRTFLRDPDIPSRPILPCSMVNGSRNPADFSSLTKHDPWVQISGGLPFGYDQDEETSNSD